MDRTSSPRSDDEGIEQQIRAKGLTAPRVTRETIEEEIQSEHYFTGMDGAQHRGELARWKGNWEVPRSIEALELLTFCVLVLKNGFTIVGTSACASAENFDAEIGRRIARENAIQQIWPLLGFRLKDQLAGGQDAPSEKAGLTD